MNDRQSTSTSDSPAEPAAEAELSVHESAAPRRGRAGRSWFARILIGASSAVLMLGVAFLGLFAMLSRGPIELPFLKERISAALEQRMGGQIDVEVGSAVIQKSQLGMELHVQNIIFRDAKGREIINAPDSVIAFDALRLAAFDLVPRALALKKMSVHAEITLNGEIRLTSTVANQPPITPVGEAPRLQEAIGFLAGIIFNSENNGLKSFSISDSTLRLDDLRSGRNTVFDRFDIAFETRTNPEVGSAIAPAANISGALVRGALSTPFEINVAKQAAELKLGARIRNVDHELISTIAGGLPSSISSNAAFNLELDSSLTFEGKPISAGARISSGPSTVKFDSAAPMDISFDQLAASGHWSAATNSVQDIQLSFVGQGHRISTTGTLQLPSDLQPVYRFEGKGKDWQLAPLGKADQAIVANSEMVIIAPSTLDSVRIKRLDVTGPQSNINITANVDPSGHLNINLKSGNMPLRSVLRWWPSIFAPEAHSYFNQNVISGTSTQLGIVIDLSHKALVDGLAFKPLPEKSILLDIVFDNAALRIVDGLPPLTGLSGNGKLNMRQASGVATRGALELKSGRRVPLSDGTFLISKLDTVTPEAVFKFRTQAALEAVGELLNQPPVKGTFAIKGIPNDARGQLDGRVSISIPLAKEIKPGDILTEVSATMTGVSIDKAIGKEKLENATLALSSDKTGIEIKGNGTWQGLPVMISLENDASDKSSAAVLSFNFDDAALKRRGINLGKQLSGSLPVKVKTNQEDGESFRSSVEIDLTRAAIDGLFPGFQKPAGRSARITFDAVEKGTGYALQNIALDSGASSFRGQAEATGDGTITSARFSLFRLSPGDNVRLEFDRQNTGAKVTVRGNNLDARPFLKAISEAGAPAAGQDKDLEIDLKTTLLSGHSGEVLTNSELRLLRRQGQFRQLNLTGKLNGEAVKVSGRSVNDSPAPLSIQCDDAGALLRFMDIYSRMIGGDMIGQITPGNTRRLDGNVLFRNFSLRNEPAIRRLVSANNADGTIKLAGDTAFSKMRIDFTRNGTENTIKEAVIFGPQIGLTFNGVIDSVRDRISLSGTFIPAYGLNNALAQIPLIGNILAGGRNEGLLALTFGISGRASQPIVSVNPLSAVAPGILRKIFEFRNETTRNTLPPAYSAPN